MISPQLIKNILLVEDNASNQDLMQFALEENNFVHNLHMVNNGKEALLFLRKQKEYAHVPRPDIILLDLNLPGIHGHELLKIIKQDPKLKIIPVIVFTSSSQPQDIRESYKLKANCYLSKPYDLEDFFLLVQKSVNFWLKSSKLPEE